MPLPLRTPLHLSCARGLSSISIHLLTLRAAVNALDGEGATPLHKVGRKGRETTVECHVHVTRLIKGWICLKLNAYMTLCMVKVVESLETCDVIHCTTFIKSIL